MPVHNIGEMTFDVKTKIRSIVRGLPVSDDFHLSSPIFLMILAFIITGKKYLCAPGAACWLSRKKAAATIFQRQAKPSVIPFEVFAAAL